MSHPTTVLALLVACAALPAAVAPQTVAIPDVTIADVRKDATRPGMIAVAPSLSGHGEVPPADRNAVRIDSIFSDLDSEHSPGCAVGAYEAGEVLFAKGYGMASLEHGIPMSPQSVLGLASVSKQFTALAIILLNQRGELSLEDHVRDYIPELPDYAAPVTIRHLIHHTSGLRDNVALLRLARENVDGDADEIILSMLGWQNALNFRPGEHWMYNTGGYSLLAMVVERVTGTSFREFTDREIFAPLGMASSGFFGPVTTEGRALAYEPYGTDRYRLSIPTHTLAGPTGLYSTIEDLARWDRNFYDMRVGGREGISLMHVPGRLSSGEETTDAFGLRLQRYRGVPVVMHSGFDPGYTSMMIRFPDQRLTVALLCNVSTANPWSRAYQVADLYLADHAAVEPVLSSDEDEYDDADRGRVPLEEMTGIYASSEGSLIQRLTVEEASLFVTGAGFRYPLRAVGERRFRDDYGFTLTFSEPDPGNAITASWSPNPTPRSGEPLRLERIGRHWEPAPGELADFAGRFFSEELDATWNIVAGPDGLVLRRWGMADRPLEPLMRDAFSFPGSAAPLLRFERDRNGRVARLTVSNAQLLGIEFARRD
jgi:CubicO group peptidase (beta-lactamase class C family)